MRNIPPAWLWAFAICFALELATVYVGVRLIEAIR